MKFLGTSELRLSSLFVRFNSGSLLGSYFPMIVQILNSDNDVDVRFNGEVALLPHGCSNSELVWYLLVSFGECSCYFF
jgi:hypothetical protein